MISKGSRLEEYNRKRKLEEQGRRIGQGENLPSVPQRESDDGNLKRKGFGVLCSSRQQGRGS